MPRIPDWLRYETQHRIERLQERFQGLRLRESVNDNPKAVGAVASVSVLLLAVVFWAICGSSSDRRSDAGRTVFYYDANTGKLFVAKNKGFGPIKAPSGPLPHGGPAGFRAHVYSYVLDPNESELFVGFLQKPDPSAKSPERASVENAVPDWAVGTLIRRVDIDDEDEEPCPWVAPMSRPGREILEALTNPNQRGQSPIYQRPKRG